MRKINYPLLLIIASTILIIVNFINSWDKMDFGFWGRIISLILLILAMVITIRETKKNKEKRGYKK
ncbi:hypothetical protein SAMN03080594_103193 [Arenibacter palladensis]|uniref:Uncharacterized protein n=1 Tax=Arenibacter palladensis TaxID=237373 RepID=A0A1M5ADF4_9FLAO|nr:hypothetical protein [Arenibacter palladensis]MDO6602416.1 hypothetical protein [Arenibacter palladensis]SHF28137.1 hypothetical protein SAMN03080594_103193 [Arenibacter palladensis]